MRSTTNYWICGIAALAVLCVTVSANAYTVNFGDTAVNWPGYADTKHPNDEIGQPIFPNLNLTAGSVALTSENRLQSITVKYRSNSEGGWGLLQPGDLFLDTDTTTGWDYVAHRSGVAGDGFAGNWTLYSFTTDIALGTLGHSDAYAVVPLWPGYIVRDGHPWALAANTISQGASVGTVNFSGWDALGPNQSGESIFTLSGSGLKVNKLLIGFTVNCANDVLYENISLNPPTGGSVPEPASMIVWGLLSLTFAGGSWRLAFLRRLPRKE